MIGFLQPWFLLAAGAAAVPLLLHFFFRRRTESFAFPAIRYLLRTERDHARRIRSEQLLLLALRIAIVAVTALLGARLYFAGPGASHDPTAVAIVLDNSMSTSIVEGGRRHLEALKEAALESVAGAGHDDVFWVLRAGEPWRPAVRATATEATDAVAGTKPSHGPGDLRAAVARARALVGQSGLAAQEVHVFTDMQASGITPSGVAASGMAASGIAGSGIAASGIGASSAGAGPATVPVLVFGVVSGQARANRGITDIAFDGGLRPLAGDRTEVAVTLWGAAGDDGPPEDSVAVRLSVGGRIRAAGFAPAGATVRLPAGPFATGRLDGYAEIDSDALAADDRRWFAMRVREPTPVATTGTPGRFVDEVLGVLEEHGRVARVPPAGAAALFSAAGAGLDRRTPSQAAVVVPGSDPALLASLNRRLAQAGIPFAYAAGGGTGGGRVTAHRLPVALDGLEVFASHRLVATDASGVGQSAADESPPGHAETGLGRGAQSAADGTPPGAAGPVRPSELVVLSSGRPWLVAGRSRSGPYLLFASALEAESTEIAVSAAMVPLFEWIVGQFAGGGIVSVPAGSPVLLPNTALRVRGPDDAEHVVDGGQPFLETGLTGIYEVRAGAVVLDSLAVNAPAEESDLSPASPAEVRAAIPGTVAVANDLADWRNAIFRSRRGPEPWRLLLVLLLGLLVAESLVGAPRRLRGRRLAPQGEVGGIGAGGTSRGTAGAASAHGPGGSGGLATDGG